MAGRWFGRIARLSEATTREQLWRSVDHRVAAALSTAKAVIETAAFLRHEGTPPRLLPAGPQDSSSGGEGSEPKLS